LRAKRRTSSVNHGVALGQAGLEDYAFAAQGLLAWSELTHSDSDFQLAARWVNAAWQRFHDNNGWVLSDQNLISTSIGVPVLEESPLPSPSSTLLQLSLQVAKHSDDRMLLARTKAALMAGHSQLQEVAFDYPSQVRLLADFQR
jgi:hypothetical protein